MEPEGTETDKINHENAPSESTAELQHDLSPAIGRRHLIGAAGKNLGKHHAAPELIEVKHCEAGNHHTEGEHVLRSPLYRLGASGYVVRVVTASLLVLDSKPECVDDVNYE